MISFIIVDYNSIDKTLEYITKFKNINISKEEISFIIIDNYSKETKNAYIEEKCGNGEEYNLSSIQKKCYLYKMDGYKLIYFSSSDNLGYARGNNLGAKIAKELFNSDYYIISNNDIKFLESFDFGIFIEIFKNNENIALIGPRVIGLNGKEQSPHKRVGAFKNLIARYWFRYWPFKWSPDLDYTGESKICYRVMGSFMILRADAFDMVEGFDPKTFMYAEEMILSEKLLKKKYKCFFYNDYTVVHEHGYSVKKISNSLDSEEWSFESCVYYYREYMKTPDILLSIARINFSVHKINLVLRKKIKSILVRW